VTALATVALATWSTFANRAVTAERAPERDLLITRHLFIALLPLLVVSLPLLSPLMRTVVTLGYFGPLLLADPNFSWIGPALRGTRGVSGAGERAAASAYGGSALERR
jgi:hypothetical protein